MYFVFVNEILCEIHQAQRLEGVCRKKKKKIEYFKSMIGGERMICTLCPRMCRAERTAESGHGFCRMGTQAVVARVAPHFWEEPCISGTRGSGTVFFSGCSLGCAYCQNHSISHERQGKRVSEAELAALIQNLETQGVHNISFVTEIGRAHV